MKTINTTTLKARVKRVAAPAITGAVVGAAVTANLYHRKYWPKGKVAIQLPPGVLETMCKDGKKLAIDAGKLGWFTLKYHPNNPKK